MKGWVKLFILLGIISCFSSIVLANNQSGHPGYSYYDDMNCGTFGAGNCSEWSFFSAAPTMRLYGGRYWMNHTAAQYPYIENKLINRPLSGLTAFKYDIVIGPGSTATPEIQRCTDWTNRNTNGYFWIINTLTAGATALNTRIANATSPAERTRGANYPLPSSRKVHTICVEISSTSNTVGLRVYMNGTYKLNNTATMSSAAQLALDSICLYGNADANGVLIGNFKSWGGNCSQEPNIINKPVITLSYPTNKTHYNPNSNWNKTLKIMTDVKANCTLNNTNWALVRNSILEHNFYNSGAVADRQYIITVRCNSSATLWRNSTINFTVDTVLPTITVTRPLNNTLWNSSFNMITAFYDKYLWRTNITIKRMSDNKFVYSRYMSSLTSSWDNSTKLLNNNATYTYGRYSIYLQAADSHTEKDFIEGKSMNIIKEDITDTKELFKTYAELNEVPIVDDKLIVGEIGEVEPEENLLVPSEGNVLIHELEKAGEFKISFMNETNADIIRETDRIKYNITTNNTGRKTVIIESGYMERIYSDYACHFVIASNQYAIDGYWYDCEGMTNPEVIELIPNQKYQINYDMNENEVITDSLGGLNEKTATYYFMVDNTKPAFTTYTITPKEHSIKLRFSVNEAVNYSYSIGSSCALAYKNATNISFATTHTFNVTALRSNTAYKINVTVWDNASNSQTHCYNATTPLASPIIRSSRILPSPNAFSNQSLLGFCNASQIDGYSMRYGYNWSIFNGVQNTTVESADSYKITGSFINASKLYDGNWHTFGIRNTSSAFLYENYTIPSQYSGALYIAKVTSSVNSSRDIPSGCLKNNLLQLYIGFFTPSTLRIACYNYNIAGYTMLMNNIGSWEIYETQLYLYNNGSINTTKVELYSKSVILNNTEQTIPISFYYDISHWTDTVSATDGNWATSSRCSGSSADCMLYINYTKPDDRTDIIARLFTKAGPTVNNSIYIPIDCLETYNNRISLKLNSDRTINAVIYYCLNKNKTWKYLTTINNPNSAVFENKMFIIPRNYTQNKEINVNNLSANYTNIGNNIMFSCQGYSTGIYTSWLNSNLTYILSTSPVTKSSLILPDYLPKGTTALGYCNGSDEDNSSIRMYYRWFANGILRASGNKVITNGTQVNIANFSSIIMNKSDILTLECKAYDGTTYASGINYSKIINDSRPVTQNANIYPAIAYGNESLRGYCNGTDVDIGDTLRYSYKWYVNGIANKTGLTTRTFAVNQSVNIDNISSSWLKVNQQWILECRAYDGTLYANNKVNSTIKTIQGQFNINNLAITPYYLNTSTDVNCVFNISSIILNPYNVSVKWYYKTIHTTIWTQLPAFDYTFINVQPHLYITGVGNGSIPSASVSNYNQYKCQATVNNAFSSVKMNTTQHNAYPLENLTIISPANNTFTNNPVLNAYFRVIDYDGGINCSLYVNATTILRYNIPNGTIYNISYSVPTQRPYSWRIGCIANGNTQTLYSLLRFFEIDTIKPWFGVYTTSETVTLPQIGDTISINMSIFDNKRIDTCKLSIKDNGTWFNASSYSLNRMQNVVLNTTYVVTPVSIHSNNNITWKIWCNDSAGNVNVSIPHNITVKDTSYPTITLLANNTLKTNNRSVISNGLYNLTITAQFYNANLDKARINITCPLNGSIYSSTATDINTTTYVKASRINLWRLPQQRCKVELWAINTLLSESTKQYYFYIGSYIKVSTLNLYDNGTYITGYFINVTTLNSAIGYNGSIYSSTTTKRIENLTNGTYEIKFSHPRYFYKQKRVNLQTSNYSLLFQTYQGIINMRAINVKTSIYLTNFNTTILNNNNSKRRVKNLIDNVTTTSTFYMNQSSGTFRVRVRGYSDYNTTYTLAFRENKTIIAQMGFSTKFMFIDERTLRPFNVSTANITFYVYCTNATFATTVTTANQSIFITCNYTKLKVVLDYTSTSYYRSFYFVNGSSLNQPIYLIDITNTPSVFNTFVIDDLLKTYENPVLYVKKAIGNQLVQITANEPDLENKVSAYLILSHEYTLELTSSNQPTQVIGTYSADSAGTKNIRLYIVTAGSSATGAINNVNTLVTKVNQSGTLYAYADYVDGENKTTFVTYNVYLDRYNGTLLYSSTVPGANRVQFNYNISQYVNKTVFGELVYTRGGVTNRFINMVNSAKVWAAGIGDAIKQGYITTAFLNWFITILFSVIGLYATIKTGNFFVLIIGGLAVIFSIFNIYTVAGPVLAIVIIVALISTMKERSRREAF